MKYYKYKKEKKDDSTYILISEGDADTVSINSIVSNIGKYTNKTYCKSDEFYSTQDLNLQ